MFSTIFKFEIKRWLNTPAFYIYCFIFFALSVFVTASVLGVFSQATATISSPLKVNSALSIYNLINSFTSFVYFLIPTIIGASVYRDYNTNMHNVLFSYPLTKGNYILAKFLSSVSITLLVVCTTILGFIIAQFLPGVREDLLGPNRAWAYLQVLVISVIPNILLFGSIVFGLVTFTRNIYVGFVFVLLLFVFQSVIQVFSTNAENLYTIALWDPFGDSSISYLTKYWTIAEKNNNDLPFEGVFIYNRIIWLAVAVLIFAAVSYSFSFTQAAFTFKKASKGTRVIKDNFGSIIRINLPEVHFNYTFLSRLKLVWNLSNFDFRFIIRNWTFIIIMALTVLMALAVSAVTGEIYGTETYPVTWKMLDVIDNVYSFFILVLIFLFSGILLNRAQTDRINLLVDATATPNWVLYFSKYIALVKMVITISLVGVLSGVTYQSYNGYYNFELGLYLKQLLGLQLLSYLVLIPFAMCIQSFLKNYMAGFMVCLLSTILFPLLPKIGIEQSIFIFNRDVGFSYSDMNGFGNLNEYFTYRLYWLFFAFILTIITIIFYKRGIVSSVKERFLVAKKRFKPSLYIPLILAIMAFVSLGYTIYYQNNVLEKYISAKDREQQNVDYEKKYKRYSIIKQPRIIDTKVDMDIFPDSRDYKAKVTYILKNKGTTPIDTIFVNHSDNLQKIEIGNDAKEIVTDSLLEVRIYSLGKRLMPGDSLLMVSYLQNKKNTFFKDNSPVLHNGTFINNTIFPAIGYLESAELVDNTVRKKYNLPNRDRMSDPRDVKALQNTYISSDADWIQFETVVSTDESQTAIAPGYLIKEWQENGRRYFHYRMDQKMLNFYAFISGRYAVKKEKHNDINLEIYYHKDHIFNLDRMTKGLKDALGYYEREFSPYQFNQIRIIEFPLTHGTFAQAFANTIPFSEGFGFIAKVDEENPNAVDYPYSVTAHELAHQWWAHQVIGANVKGATMLSESLAEYSSLKVLEHTYGKGQMRKFLKIALDEYLEGRGRERIKENPLMYNENQQYIHYQKGSLVMYAMSEYMGEKNFNNFLKEYIKRVAFQEAPYTTAIEFVDLLKTHVPDSLQYLVKDMFETITLYDNSVQSVTSKKLPNGKYQVDITFNISKYRAADNGERLFEDIKGTALSYGEGDKKIQSLPLADYIEIAIFGDPKGEDLYAMDNEVFLKKYKIDKINNKISIVVDQKPYEVGVDPYNKLIDTNSNDNRKKI